MQAYFRRVSSHFRIGPPHYIVDVVTVGGWGEGVYAKGVVVSGEGKRKRKRKDNFTSHHPSPLLVKCPITIQDGGN